VAFVNAIIYIQDVVASKLSYHKINYASFLELQY